MQVTLNFLGFKILIFLWLNFETWPSMKSIFYHDILVGFLMNNFRSFVDKRGRKIKIKWEDDVLAYHNGKEIGRIDIDHPDGKPILWTMEVNRGYQRAGIATEMMKTVAEIYGKDVGKPSLNAVGGKNANSEDYYTQEGAEFIYSCIDKGILIDTDPNDYWPF